MWAPASKRCPCGAASSTANKDRRRALYRHARRELFVANRFAHGVTRTGTITRARRRPRCFRCSCCWTGTGGPDRLRLSSRLRSRPRSATARRSASVVSRFCQMLPIRTTRSCSQQNKRTAAGRHRDRSDRRSRHRPVQGHPGVRQQWCPDRRRQSVDNVNIDSMICQAIVIPVAMAARHTTAQILCRRSRRSLRSRLWPRSPGFSEAGTAARRA
jgi:hypothetical protein